MDWSRWVTTHLPSGRWATLPCHFPEPDDDPELMAAVRWTLGRLDDELARVDSLLVYPDLSPDDRGRTAIATVASGRRRVRLLLVWLPFGFLRLGEREGSGGPTMRRVWREQHWRAPRIWEDVEHNEAHLQLPFESLLPDRAVNTLVDRWGTRFTGQDNLGRIILVTAEVEGSLSHARARELTDAHSRDITLKLQELVRNGLLDSSGKMRGKSYTPKRCSDLPLFADRAANSPQSASNSPQSAPSSQQSVVERVARSRWAAAQDVRVAILALCERTYRTVAELADVLNRKATTLQQNYVTKMLSEGLLEAKYPETPNHPSQAYRARRQHEGDDA